MNDVVIVAAKRTPMGAFQGALSSFTAPELGAEAIKAAIAGINTASAPKIDEVYMGCVLPAGLKQAPARQAVLNAGLPASTPSTTVNKVCGSGMKAVMLAADQIKVGAINSAAAGGMESMSNAPFLLEKARAGYRMGHQQVLDHMFIDGLEDAYDGQAMGVHAQLMADKKGITREQMDQFALESLRRAQAAIDSGYFVDEIVPVTVRGRAGEVTIEQDEQPSLARPDKIPSLRSAFAEGGTITAANASSISDGAAALVIMSRQQAESLGLNILATIKSYASHAQAPSEFTSAPIGAIQKALQLADWQTKDVELAEVNEAFAMVAMMAMDELGLSHDITNVNGGACALGHPLGCSGARIIVTLLHNMIRLNQHKGIAALCIGGGEGTALCIER